MFKNKTLQFYASQVPKDLESALISGFRSAKRIRACHYPFTLIHDRFTLGKIYRHTFKQETLSKVMFHESNKFVFRENCSYLHCNATLVYSHGILPGQFFLCSLQDGGRILEL